MILKFFGECFHSSLKLELCRHACRRRDPIISTCRYRKNMPTTALLNSYRVLIFRFRSSKKVQVATSTNHWINIRLICTYVYAILILNWKKWTFGLLSALDIHREKFALNTKAQTSYKLTISVHETCPRISLT